MLQSQAIELGNEKTKGHCEPDAVRIQHTAEQKVSWTWTSYLLLEEFSLIFQLLKKKPMYVIDLTT